MNYTEGEGCLILIFFNGRKRHKGDQYLINKFLKNCPPTPPLSQHFALSEK